MKRRLVDLATVLALISVVATAAHFWIADRRALFRAIYPLEAQVSAWSSRCSEHAPDWMALQLDLVTRNGGSLANQVAFASPDGRLHHCENGWIDGPLRSPPVSQQTRFRYASLTKIFTADAVLGLISDGKLRLDSRLIEFLPDLGTPSDPRIAEVTIEHLLRHQAGFDRSQTLDVMFAHNHKPWCPYDLQLLSRFTLDFAPGERYSYSNRGYCLLGQVIERVSGKTYREYIRQHYGTDELGIRFIGGPYLADEVRYDFRNEGFYGETYYRFFDFEALSSVASLSGSASALAHSVRRMLARRELNLLSAELPQECGMERHDDCFGFAPYPYAQKGTARVFIHKGLLPGAESLLMIDEDGGVLVILTSGTVTKGARKSLLDKLYGARIRSVSR